MVITRINYWFRILAPLLFCPSPSKRGKKVDALWVGDCHGAQVENVFFSSPWLCFFPTPRAKQPWWGLKREHCVSSQWPYVLERLGEGDVHSAALPRRHCCKFHLISGALFHRAHAGGCLWRCREGGTQPTHTLKCRCSTTRPVTGCVWFIVSGNKVLADTDFFLPCALLAFTF